MCSTLLLSFSHTHTLQLLPVAMEMFAEVFKEEVSLRTKAVQDVEKHRVCVVVCMWCVCVSLCLCPVSSAGPLSVPPPPPPHVQEELSATVDESTGLFESELTK